VPYVGVFENYENCLREVNFAFLCKKLEILRKFIKNRKISAFVVEMVKP
jgi:hypothetical protein